MQHFRTNTSFVVFFSRPTSIYRRFGSERLYLWVAHVTRPGLQQVENVAKQTMKHVSDILRVDGFSNGGYPTKYLATICGFGNTRGLGVGFPASAGIIPSLETSNLKAQPKRLVKIRGHRFPRVLIEVHRLRCSVPSFSGCSVAR